MEGGQYKLFFLSLLYGMPAPSAECRHPEAWPASTYRHLKEVLDSGALNDHWAFGRLGHWVHVELSCHALGRRGSRSSGTQTQQVLSIMIQHITNLVISTSSKSLTTSGLVVSLY